MSPLQHTQKSIKLASLNASVTSSQFFMDKVPTMQIMLIKNQII